MEILTHFKNHPSHGISAVASRFWKTEYQSQVKIGLVPYMCCLFQQATLRMYSQSTITINKIDNTD